MEQELRFGLDLGQFGNFWGWFFHVFMGNKKKFKNIVDGENIFEVYGGFRGQKILKLWRQESRPFGPNPAQISIPVP